MTIFNVLYSNEIEKAILNPKDCKENDLYEGDLVELLNEETGSIVYCLLSILESIPQDNIALGQNLMDNLGVLENAIISISRCEKSVTKAKAIEIEYDSQDYNPSMLTYDEKFRLQVVEFLRKYYYNPTNELFWPEKNARLIVKFPELAACTPPYGISEYNDEIILKIVQKTTLMPFNALLAIDCSGSMHHHDISFSQMSGVLDELLDIYDGNTPQHNELKQYLTNLRPKYLIDPENYKVSRVDAALIAMLLFFNQKISRGLGERCSILLYSGQTKLFTFQGNKTVFDATDMTNINIITSLKADINNPRDLQTNQTIFNPVFSKIKEITEDFSKISKNPVLILFLTDGKPEPQDMETSNLIYDKIRELIEHSRRIQRQIVIYTIGIGNKDDVDFELLTKIAQLGHGTYYFTKDLKELSDWFQNLAREFSITLQKVEI